MSRDVPFSPTSVTRTYTRSTAVERGLFAAIITDFSGNPTRFDRTFTANESYHDACCTNRDVFSIHARVHVNTCYASEHVRKKFRRECSGEYFALRRSNVRVESREGAGALGVSIRFIESNFGDDTLLATDTTSALSRRAKLNSFATSLREVKPPKK